MAAGPDRRGWVFEGTDAAPRCHASTIVEAVPGVFLAAWFAGSGEGADDSANWMARFEDGAWSEPRVFANVEGHAHGNPRLFRLGTGDLAIIYAVNYGAWCRGGSRNFIRTSADVGRSWSCPREIVTDPPFLGKNKALLLADPPESLLPVTIEGDPYAAAVLLGTPEGDYWVVTQVLHGSDDTAILQPTLARLSDGSVLMLLRTTGGRLWRCRSADRGRTWSPPEPTDLPNNYSGIDLAPLPDGSLLLALNPVADRKKRTPLVLMRSADDGETWRTVATLEDGDGEFSYPALITASDGSVHCTYTHRRTRIAHAAFAPGAFA